MDDPYKLYGKFLHANKEFKELVKTYTYEEKQNIKKFLTGEFTKYVNNLKQVGKEVPYLYDHTQACLGNFTIIMYWCAAPFICNILLKAFEKENALFVALCADPLFYSYWIKGDKSSHFFNTFSNNPASLKVHKNSVLNLLEVKSSEPVPEGTTVFNVLNRNLAKLTPEQKVEYEKITREIIIPKYSDFIKEITTIRDFINIKTLETVDYKILTEIMERLKTIYVFYFKGGNSIRKIIDRFNETSSFEDIKIKNINDVIPYGSDFDTNILINPYLPDNIVKEIKSVIDIFIPIISQFIKIPREFKDHLINPARETTYKILHGTIEKNDEQQTLYNAAYMYNDLTLKYVKKETRDKSKRRLAIINTKPHFYISPETEEIPNSDGAQIKKKSVVMSCIGTCGSMVQVSTSPEFPNILNNASQAVFHPYMGETKKDYCFGCLQYSINDTIPKFKLHRFFLKFKLGERYEKFNAKHRILGVNSHYNAELIDISIVNPIYTLDVTGTKIHCELIDLWNNSTDIFKIQVLDYYKDLSSLQYIPKIGNIGDKKKMPIFINGLQMQINDLIETINDTVKEKNYTKLPKRIKRLRLLNYLKNLSPFYDINPLIESIFFAPLIDIEVPLPKEFYTEFPTVKKEYITQEGIFYRALWEFYTSNINSNFINTYEEASKQMKFYVNDIVSPNFSIKTFIKEKVNQYINQIDIFISTNQEPRRVLLELFSECGTFFTTAFKFKVVEGAAPEYQLESLISVPGTNFKITPLIMNFIPEKINSIISYLIKDENNDYKIPCIMISVFIDQIKQYPPEIITKLQTHIKPEISKVIQKIGNIDLKPLLEIPLVKEPEVVAQVSVDVEIEENIPINPIQMNESYITYNSMYILKELTKYIIESGNTLGYFSTTVLNQILSENRLEDKPYIIRYLYMFTNFIINLIIQRKEFNYTKAIHNVLINQITQSSLQWLQEYESIRKLQAYNYSDPIIIEDIIRKLTAEIFKYFYKLIMKVNQLQYTDMKYITSYSEIFNSKFVSIPWGEGNYLYVNTSYTSNLDLMFFYIVDSKLYIGTVYPNILTAEYKIENTEQEIYTIIYRDENIVSTTKSLPLRIVPINQNIINMWSGKIETVPLRGGRSLKLKNKNRKITKKNKKKKTTKKLRKGVKKNTTKYKK